MTSFFLIQLVLVLVALAFIFVPVIRYKSRVSQTNLSAQWFLDRQQELKTELESGRYDQAAYEEALHELKLTAKQELSAPNENRKLFTGKLGVTSLAVIAIVVSGSVGFYAYQGQYNKLSDWQQTLAKMPELSQKVIQDSSEQVSAQELAEFALGLRTKLAEKEDQVGWMLLGRVLMALQDVDGSISAFENSYEMAPYNVSNNLSYAQALQAKGEEYNIRHSLRLLQQVLVSDPTNQMAQIMIAEAYLLLQEFDKAQRIYSGIVGMLADTDPRKQAVQARLSFLNQQLNQTGASGATITVQIQLAEQVQAELDKFSNLFVFAKTPQMPMPIAVKKLPVASYQQPVVLSDADLMLPEVKLSDFTNVQVFARLSVDEQATFAAGEWQGSVDNVSTDKNSAVTVIIDKAF